MSMDSMLVEVGYEQLPAVIGLRERNDDGSSILECRMSQSHITL